MLGPAPGYVNRGAGAGSRRRGGAPAARPRGREPRINLDIAGPFGAAVR